MLMRVNTLTHTCYTVYCALSKCQISSTCSNILLMQETCWTYGTQLGAAELLQDDNHGVGGSLQFYSDQHQNFYADWLACNEAELPVRIGFTLKQFDDPMALLSAVRSTPLEDYLKQKLIPELFVAHATDARCSHTHFTRHDCAAVIIDSWRNPGSLWKVR